LCAVARAFFCGTVTCFSDPRFQIRTA
jgi:hypothetical protein